MVKAVNEPVVNWPQLPRHFAIGWTMQKHIGKTQAILASLAFLTVLNSTQVHAFQITTDHDRIQACEKLAGAAYTAMLERQAGTSKKELLAWAKSSDSLKDFLVLLVEGAFSWKTVAETPSGKVGIAEAYQGEIEFMCNTGTGYFEGWPVQ